MISYTTLSALTQSKVYPFLLEVIYLRYIYGTVIINISTSFPLIRIIPLSSSSSIMIWINAWVCKYLPHNYLTMRHLWRLKALTQALRLGIRHISYQGRCVVYDQQLLLFLWQFCIFYILEKNGKIVPHHIIIWLGCVGLVFQMCFGGAAVLSNFILHQLLLFEIFSLILSYIAGSWNNVSHGTNKALGFISCGCLIAYKGMKNLLHCQL